MVTAERLRQILDYDPNTGVFTWKVRTSNRIRVGSVAGSSHGGGYLQINVDGQNYLAHRLVWLHFYGSWPKYCMDHINGVRRDNRIANLRDVPISINAQNIRRPMVTNTTGLLGVSWNSKDRVYCAHISIRNKSIYVGSFDSALDAHAAYLAMKRKAHVGCTI